MPETPPAQVAILATSLDAGSRSQIMARYAAERLEARGVSCTLIDLRGWNLPLGGGETEAHQEEVSRLKRLVQPATHLLFAVPVYNWDVNAAAKNLLEILSGHELDEKTVGFLCAAGGQSSYMSVLPFANSLMLDFRCWIVPRFVYATGGDFGDNEIRSEKVRERIELLLDELFSRVPVPRPGP